MPRLRNKRTGGIEDIPDASAQQLIATGEWELAEGARVNIDLGAGNIVSVPAEARAGAYQNIPVESEREAGTREYEDLLEEEYGGPLGAVQAFGVGGARGITLGLSDAALVALGVEPEELEALKRIQTAADLTGTLVGSVASSAGATGGPLLSRTAAGRLIARTPGGQFTTPPGAFGMALREASQFTPQGAISTLAAKTVRLGESFRPTKSLANQAGRRMLTTGGGVAIEGAAAGAGQAFSSAIIHDHPLTAEALVAGAGSGALYGAALGMGVEALGGAARAGLRKLQEADPHVRRATTLAAKSATKTAAKVGSGTAESILLSTPRRASSAELNSLRLAEREMVDAAEKHLSLLSTPVADKAALPHKIDDVVAAGRAMGDGSDGAAVGAYHDAIRELAEQLRRMGKEMYVPPNPAARLQTEHGAVARVEELVSPVDAGRRTALRQELRSVVEQLDASATPLIEEAKSVVAAHRPVDQIGGQSIIQLLEAAEGDAGLAGLLRRAEAAQQSFYRAFDMDPGGPTASLIARPLSDDVLEKILSSSPKDFSGALKALQGYDDAIRGLAAAVDGVAPAPGMSRLGQLEQLHIPRAGAANPMESGWDMGDILAIADLAGIDLDTMPGIGAIPGVGLMLQARMAYRGLRNKLDKVRMIGSAGKVGSIAARAQAFKASITQAVKKFVSGKRTGRAVIPSAAAVLHAVSYSGTEPPAKETKQEAFTRVSEELITAHESSGQIAAGLRDRLKLDVPALVDPILEAARRKIAYLAGVLPKDPREPSILRSEWQPDELELEEFAERVWAAEQPLQVLGALGAGYLTYPAAETFREVYPAMFGQLQREMVLELADTQEDLSLDRQSQLSILLDLPVSAFEEPTFVAAMQEGYQAQQQQPSPQPGQQPRLSGLDQMMATPTPADASAFG